MIQIKIPTLSVNHVFTKAGYEMHRLGYFQGGYIRNLAKGRRFHAKYIASQKDYEKFEVHIDQTVNGFHRLVYEKTTEKLESLRLRDIKSSFDQNSRLNVRKRKKAKIIKARGEFAPNLREIQKQFHGKIRGVFNPLRYLKGKFYE